MPQEQEKTQGGGPTAAFDPTSCWELSSKGLRLASRPGFSSHSLGYLRQVT